MNLRAILWLFLLAVSIRGVALWKAHDATLILDEKRYVRNAEALLDGKGFVGSYQSAVRHPRLRGDMQPMYPGAFQPPVYTLFLASILALSDHSVVAVKAVQVLLSALTVLLVYGLGCDWFDERRARLAALICAVYPNLIAFSHYLWTETIFIALTLPAIGILARRSGLPSRWATLLSGLLFGLAALTRAAVVAYVPVLLAWFLVVHRAVFRKALVRAFIVVLAMVAVITPWTVRNYYVHHGFVMIDSNGPYNLWRGNNPISFRDRGGELTVRCFKPPFDWVPIGPVASMHLRQLIRQVQEIAENPQPTDLQVMAHATKFAKDHIRSDPRDFLRRAYYKMVDMWNPTSFLLRHFELGAYGPVSERVVTWISWSAVVSYLAVMIFAVVGVAVRWKDSRTWLVVLLVAFYCAIHMVAFALTRYRLPLIPFLALMAAQGVFSIGALTLRVGSRWTSPSQN